MGLNETDYCVLIWNKHLLSLVISNQKDIQPFIIVFAISWHVPHIPHFAQDTQNCGILVIVIQFKLHFIVK